MVLQKETSHPGRLQRRDLIILLCCSCRATTGEDREWAAAGFKFRECCFASRPLASHLGLAGGRTEAVMWPLTTAGWRFEVDGHGRLVLEGREGSDGGTLLGEGRERSGFPREIPGLKA